VVTTDARNRHEEGHRFTRRAFLALGAGIAPMACASEAVTRAIPGPERLTARPLSPPPAPPPPAGESPLSLGERRDGLLFVPRQLRRSSAPLLLLLHGATGSARRITKRTAAFDLAEELGIVVLAPDSRNTTWDIVSGVPGADVEFIGKALRQLFARVPIDRSRLAIGGFSDGASYALSLGLTNGDLFSRIVAFSPGFIKAPRMIGHPAIFISHGTRDDILSIDHTSRVMVPDLEKAGYTVRYREFTGGHTVPPEMAREGFRWMSA
jgi:phospholipase/carboxylesterase